MACTATAAQPGDKLSPGDRLEKIDTTLYHFQHLCSLVSAFAGQHGRNQFTDGLPLEMYAVVFGWIGDDLRDVRKELQILHEEIPTC